MSGLGYFKICTMVLMIGDVLE